MSYPKDLKGCVKNVAEISNCAKDIKSLCKRLENLNEPYLEDLLSTYELCLINHKNLLTEIQNGDIPPEDAASFSLSVRALGRAEGYLAAALDIIEHQNKEEETCSTSQPI